MQISDKAEVSPALGATIARINNEALAAACARCPERFVPLASVPLQDPPAAARELERAAQLGLRGVQIPPNIHGQGLDEPTFEVFWEAAEALRMVVCIHPFEAAPQGMLARYNLGNLVGNLYDTGLAAALLIYGGVLERHAALRAETPAVCYGWQCRVKAPLDLLVLPSATVRTPSSAPLLSHDQTRGR